MMYGLTKKLVLRLVKAPSDPPEPPAGSHGSVRVFRAHRGFLTYSLLSFFLASAASYMLPFVLMVAATAQGKRSLFVLAAIMLPLFAVIQFFVYFAVRIDYDLRYYIVTDRSLRVREGAMIVKEKTITYANVQNLRVVQGPLMRLFGIWHLQVDTAGGGGREKGEQHLNRHSVRLAGIDNAHEIRDLILDHLRRHGRDAGLGDLDDSQPVATGFPESPELLAALRDVKAASARLRAVARPHA